MDFARWTHLKFSSLFLILVAGLAHADLSELPPAYREFMRAEGENVMVVRTEVEPKYRPGSEELFDVPYVDVPEAKMHWIEDHIREHDLTGMRFTKKGISYVRFFIHPESMELYAPLIQAYGIQGKVRAIASSSTRTVLLFDPKKPSDVYFVKLSLAKTQDRFVRVVPSKEIEKSVAITELIDLISTEDLEKNKTAFIEEYAGTYIDRSWNLPVLVGEDEGVRDQHGYIVRDASFIANPPANAEILPFFALLTDRKDAPPRVVEWFRQSGEKDFHAYLNRTIVDPMMDALGYLVYEEGLVGATHSQNLVVAVDKTTHQVVRVYHRDAGSFKVDLLIRMKKGKPIAPVMNPDFKFTRTDEYIDDSFQIYFWEMSFSNQLDMGYGRSIKKYIPEYVSSRVKAHILEKQTEQIRKWLPLEQATKVTPQEYLRKWYQQGEQQIAWTRMSELSEQQRTHIKQVQTRKAVLTLPKKWAETLPGEAEAYASEYGLLVPDRLGRLKFYPWQKPEDSIRYRKLPCRGALTPAD